MKCKHCKKPLPYQAGGRGGCYVKHGCLGEVRDYLGKMSTDDRIRTMSKAAERLRSRSFVPDHKFSLLGCGQPVDWSSCSDWFFAQWQQGNYSYKEFP